MRKILIPGVFLFLIQGWSADAALVTPGTGRFGGGHDDGLLTLNVSPSGFRTAGAGDPVEVWFADPGVNVKVGRVTPTEKLLLLSEGGEGSPVSIRYSVLYPGLSAEFRERALLRIRGAAVKMEEGGGESDQYRWLLITAAAGESPPIALAFRPRFYPTTVRFTSDGANGGTLELGSEAGIGEVRFVTPLGIDSFPADAGEAKREELRKATGVWAAIGVPGFQVRLPRYRQERSEVQILEAYTTKGGQGISPLPPPLVFAIERGYPAKVQGKVVRTECITKYGPYAFVFGNKVEYTLPVPPAQERGYIRAPGMEARRGLLNRMAGVPEVVSATRATDGQFQGAVSAQLAWAWLDDERREGLSASWDSLVEAVIPRSAPGDQGTTPAGRARVRDATGADRLPIRREPVGLEAMSAQAPADAALAIHGIVTGCQYGGAWNRSSAWKPALRKLLMSLQMADDWAWMAPVSSLEGVDTGSGADLTSVYAGSVAVLRFPPHWGSSTVLNQYAAMAARSAVPALARLWYTDWARQRGLIPNDAVVVGFSEVEPFVVATLRGEDADPVGVTGLISAHGILPEPVSLYTTYAREALEEYEREFAAARGKRAEGEDGKWDLPGAVLPHVFVRSMLGDPVEVLWKTLDPVLAGGTVGEATVAPNVLAEVMSRETPLVLTWWQPAAYLDGYVTEDGTAVVLEFDAPTGTPWTMTAQMRPGFVPRQVTIDGAVSDFVSAGDILQVSAMKRGEFEVRIEFGDGEDSEGDTKD